jgi:hypothetical protein
MENEEKVKEKNPAAVALGKLGGIARTKKVPLEVRKAISSKGGKSNSKENKRRAGARGGAARAAALTPERRKEIARNASNAARNAKAQASTQISFPVGNEKEAS